MAKGSKKEKRLQRLLEKQEIESNKKVRLLHNFESEKEVRVLHSVNTEKSPRHNKNPDSIMQQYMEYVTAKKDVNGSWTWGISRKQLDDEWDLEILPHLESLKGLTWAEIYKQTWASKQKSHYKHHDQEVAKIKSNEAIQRWKEIELEEYDTAFRFRFGGEKRLWGFKIKNVFYVVWWDPTHKVHPVEKSHT